MCNCTCMSFLCSGLVGGRVVEGATHCTVRMLECILFLLCVFLESNGSVPSKI